MAIRIEDEETERLVRMLAERRGLSIDEAIKTAVREALKTGDETPSLWERIQPLQERAAARGSTGLKAGKAFYDSLNDE